MGEHEYAETWGLNWEDRRKDETPGRFDRMVHTARHNLKNARGTMAQIEQRARYAFKRIYAARVAVAKAHTAQLSWRLLNDLVYTAWGY